MTDEEASGGCGERGHTVPGCSVDLIVGENYHTDCVSEYDDDKREMVH
jgi:hypothetical protein